MAKRSILVSDLSGEEVTEENGANVRITYPGNDKAHVFDLTQNEVNDLFTVDGTFVGREVAKRGRKSGENGATAETEAPAKASK